VIKIEFKIGGNELAKVLHYYGLLEGDSEFKIICPFHGDVNASMKINLQDGSFYCFGCGASGDALKFVLLANKHLDELKAAMKYFRILRSNKVKEVQSIKKQAKKRKEDVQALIEAEDYYTCLSKTAWGWDDTPEEDYMKNRGFSPKILKECGAKINCNVKYPLIFPMLDMGEFRGWVCRTTDKQTEAKRKYLYNEGFSRRNTLVGDYDAEVVTIVEGYMDRLKMMQYGAKNVVAILGWKITDQQINKLRKQQVKYIISALDNDACGKKGTKYLETFFNVTRFVYPEGIKDPGEMDKKTFQEAHEKTKQKFRRSKQWD
jgi:DNA primase